MLIATKTYDTSTFAGLLECVADTLGMPADNLGVQLGTTQRQVTSLTLAIVGELRKRDLPDETREQLLQQLWTVNRAMQLIEEAGDALRAAKQLGESLAPKPEPELPPGPPIRRQTHVQG